MRNTSERIKMKQQQLWTTEECAYFKPHTTTASLKPYCKLKTPQAQQSKINQDKFTRKNTIIMLSV